MSARVHMHAASTASCSSIETRSNKSGGRDSAGRDDSAWRVTCASRSGGVGREVSGAEMGRSGAAGDGSDAGK